MQPLVREAYQLRKALKIRTHQVAQRSGIPRCTPQGWFHENKQPLLGNFEAYLNAMGYGLKIVRLDDEKANS